MSENSTPTPTTPAVTIEPGTDGSAPGSSHLPWVSRRDITPTDPDERNELLEIGRRVAERYRAWEAEQAAAEDCVA